MDHTDTSLRRTSLPRRRATAALLAGLLVLGACGSDSEGDDAKGGDDAAATSTTADASAELLGPEAPASGEPLKVGYISAGKSATGDYSIEPKVADATVEYLNTHKGGLAGRPIELDTCISEGDQAKATDCANQLVQDGVSLVITPSAAGAEAIWEVIHAAQLPLMFYGAAGGKVLLDKDSTFVFANSTAGLSDLPIDAAKKNKATKVTVVTVDAPSATQFYAVLAPKMFEDAGIELEVVPVPMGTADMTPQMQTVASSDPGVVHVLGNDAFCIAAFNGLRAAGFDGPITTVSQCINDATREAVPGDFLEGITMTAPAPLGSDDPGIKLYEAVATTYADDVDLTDAFGPATFTVLAALNEVMADMAEVTPATIISTLRAAPEMELPASGGLKFRCNGKATWAPAICTRASLVTSLDDQGQSTTFDVVNDTPIED